jgi:hypothetical protein
MIRRIMNEMWKNEKENRERQSKEKWELKKQQKRETSYHQGCGLAVTLAAALRFRVQKTQQQRDRVPSSTSLLAK